MGRKGRREEPLKQVLQQGQKGSAGDDDARDHPKDLLLTHLDYTFEKEAWQPSLAMAVRGLTAAQAAWRPGPNRHSIWQIVRHVTRWKQATLAAWRGAQPLFSGHTETQRFTELMRTDWSDDAGELLRPFPGKDWPAVVRVLRMATHDIYHAGQIRYLRALQGV